jgi:hypothetical protein
VTTRVAVGAGDEAIRTVAALSGDLCHYTPAFLRATLEPGSQLVLFTVEDDGRLTAGAIGYKRRGRVLARLTFPTQPVYTGSLESASGLWDAIRGFARARRIATVSMHSFEGQALIEPPLGVVESRTPREEFVLDLAPPADQLLAAFSENHRRNIKKASSKGVALSIVTAPAAAESHAAMFRSSMERRAARGESVTLESDPDRVRRLVSSGAGVLVQARSGDAVAASLLILVSPSRAYYHSGGATPEGMKLGASHAAMWFAMQAMRDRGVRAFCLGGVSERDSAGLANYKLGFQPRRIALAHCVYRMELAFPWGLVRRLLGK